MTATAPAAASVQTAIENAYRSRTARSRALFERSTRAMPGGSTRAGTFFQPYPAYMDRGEGFQLHDIDGNEYIDCLNNYASLIHGHAHPRLVSVLAAQAARGTAHGAPCQSEVELAEELKKRVSSIELIRFANSGTEGVMGAIRAARAFTGRSLIVKMEGGYHGTYDAAEVSVAPGLTAPAFPTGVPDGPGLSPGLAGEVLVAPYNDLARLRATVERHHKQIAAVVIEPVMLAGGSIPATPEFLRGARALTEEFKTLLIFDEIASFRLAPGGAQEIYGVRPDITALGKIIGGGLPIGAYGGRADIMSVFDVRHPGAASLSGTFNGNAATMALGVAALEIYTPADIKRVNQLGARLRAGLEGAAAKAGLPARVTGMGSLSQVHLTTKAVTDYRSAAAAEHRGLLPTLNLALMNHGVFRAARGGFYLSTAMTPVVVDRVVDSFGRAAEEVARAI